MVHQTRPQFRIGSFWQSDSGSATVEFVLWFTFFMTIFVTLADVSYILFNKANVTRIVEDAHRMRSIGVYTTNTEISTAIIAELGSDRSNGATVQTSIQSGVLRTLVVIPASNLDLVGVFVNFASGPDISIDSMQAIENLEV